MDRSARRSPADVRRAALRPDHVSDATADLLGEGLALFWTADGRKEAEEFGPAGVVEIDCAQINAFGCFEDELVRGGTVWVLPLDCPQVPLTALRDPDAKEPL